MTTGQKIALVVSAGFLGFLIWKLTQKKPVVAIAGNIQRGYDPKEEARRWLTSQLQHKSDDRQIQTVVSQGTAMETSREAELVDVIHRMRVSPTYEYVDPFGLGRPL